MPVAADDDVWVEPVSAAPASAVLVANREEPMRRRRGKSLLAAFVTSLVIGVGVSSSTAESRVAQPDTASPSQSSGLKFTPSADAYVSSAKPKANYGSATRLKLEDAPVVEAYLRFPGGNLTAPVTRATLWLYAVDGSSVGYTVHAVSDTSWQESSLTFANAPAISPTVVASARGYSSGTWTTVDVTSLVASNGSANVALTSASPNFLNLASRESGSKGPVLVLETSTPDTSAPTTPSGLAVTGTTASSISLSWGAATDDVGVAGYEIYRNGSLAGTTQQAAYTLSGLACGSSYTVGVNSYDLAGNRSPATTLLVSTAACPDTSAPSASSTAPRSAQRPPRRATSSVGSLAGRATASACRHTILPATDPHRSRRSPRRLRV